MYFQTIPNFSNVTWSFQFPDWSGFFSRLESSRCNFRCAVQSSDRMETGNPLVSISVNFPISVNRNSGFFSLSEQKNGSKNEILVDLSLPLISMSFWDSSQQSARLSRNVCVRCRNIHREMNCARCAAFQSAKTCIDSFWVARRIKSYKAFSEPLFEQNFGILK